jgi:hypothetical protein
MSGRARPGRYRSPYVNGYRSLSPTPILWAIAGVFVFGAVFVLILLVLSHRGSPTRPADHAVVQPTVAPTQPTTPPQPCFPFQGTC